MGTTADETHITIREKRVPASYVQDIKKNEVTEIKIRPSYCGDKKVFGFYENEWRGNMSDGAANNGAFKKADNGLT